MANGNSQCRVGTLSGIQRWLLIASAGVLASVCMWAEAHSRWYWAQGTYIGILFVLATVGADWWRERRGKRVVPPEVTTYYEALEYLLLALAIGIIAIMIVAVGTDRWQQGIVAKSAGTGILFAGATFAIGVLFGFLFGFPPAGNAAPAAATTLGATTPGQIAVARSGTAAPHSTSVFQNTNLHEISDWLTKVIVGAGLVDLTRLPPQVSKLAYFMAQSTDPRQPSPGTALAILGYFSSCGVLFGYVWTRFEVLTTSRPLDLDADALARVDRWLNQPPDPKDDNNQLAMMNAVKAASAGARMKIFLDTEKYHALATEAAHARTLPVFQALVEADTQEIFHRNRGQNALALMGRKKVDPATAKADWQAALDLLNDAIRIRERTREPNWREYEFARAVCRIHLDEPFQSQQKSVPDLQALVRADLDKAVDVAPAQKKLIDPDDPKTQEGVTATWNKLN